MLAFEPSLSIRLGRRCEILPCLLTYTIKVWYDNCNYPLDSMSQDNVFVYNDDINKPKIYISLIIYLHFIFMSIILSLFIFIHIYRSGVKGRGKGCGGTALIKTHCSVLCGPKKQGARKRSEYIDKNNKVAIFTHL